MGLTTCLRGTTNPNHQLFVTSAGPSVSSGSCPKTSIKTTHSYQIPGHAWISDLVKGGVISKVYVVELAFGIPDSRYLEEARVTTALPTKKHCRACLSEPGREVVQKKNTNQVKPVEDGCKRLESIEFN